MSDVNVDPGDGTVTTDPSSEDTGAGISVNQTVNQAQAQSNTQQQQQAQPQFLNTPGVLIPAASHAQAQSLLVQLQALLGL